MIRRSKIIILAIVLSLSLSGCTNGIKQEQSSDYSEMGLRLAAEFEPAQGVLMVYPLNVPIELVKRVAEKDRVYLVLSTRDDGKDMQEQAEKDLSEAGVNMENITFYVHDVGESYGYWIRDFGPVFVFRDGKAEVVDMTVQNPEGSEDEYESEPDGADEFPTDFAKELGIPSDKMKLTLQGGNLMQDGRGTAVSGNLVLIDNGNDIFSIRENMRSFTGTNNYMIFDDPKLEEIGHVDCSAKFVAPDKVVVLRCPKGTAKYEEYESLADYFASAQCCWGYPYKVYRLDIPADAVDVTTGITAPYANSLMLNKRLFMPLGDDDEYNKKALAVYKEALPGYEIIGIEPDLTAKTDDNGETLSIRWENYDSLHCRTHEVPDFNMVFIDHRNVYNGEIMIDSEANLYKKLAIEKKCPVEAEIRAYSGAEWKDGSPLLYYRINDGDWQSVTMEQIKDSDRYTANITGYEDGAKIDYYIYAEDTDGNVNMQPAFGPDEPHSFKLAIYDDEDFPE